MLKFVQKDYLYVQGFYLDRILEKTFDIENDSIMLFNKFLSSYIKEIQSKKVNLDIEKKIMRGEDYLIGKTYSSILKSEDCKKAHSISKADIYFGVFKGIDSLYSHGKSSEDKIVITLNYMDLKSIYVNNFSSDDKYKKTNDIILKNLSSNRLIADIQHELSHWISNNFYNRHITNKRDLPDYISDKEKQIILQAKDVNVSYFEIDAQVHSIKILKRRLLDRFGKVEGEEIWNRYTMDDIAMEYNTITAIYDKIKIKYNEEISKIWLKALWRRLDREKLLGKNIMIFKNKLSFFY